MSEQPENQNRRKPQQAHGPDGNFVANPDTAQRDAEAAQLRGKGWGYQKIADHFGISVSTAYEAVQRALRAVRAEGAAEVKELELERLDVMYDAVMKVLEARHVTVSNGKVIQLPDADGKLVPLEDDAPVLQAVDRLLKIQQRRAALLGLDAEQKVSVSGGVRYEVVGIDADHL